MFIVEIQKRLTLLLFIFVAVVLAYTFIDINKEAVASGGAFSSTKHGGDTTVDGGVWCPVAPCGVHRNRGGEVGEYWDDPDAGKYIAGECAHCHEVHASFGDEEPPPNTGNDVGPNDYLLMAAYGTETVSSNAELCWYCHENMALGFPPTFGYGYYGFYQGQTNFENSGHGSNTADFVYPGKQADDAAAETAFARDDRSASDNIGGSCLNCHTPHGIDGSVAGNDYGAAPSATNYTATNAALTGVIPRQLIAYEESLCLRCHDADGSGGATPTNAKNVKDQLDGLFGAGSGHPVRDSATYGKHTVNSDGPAAGWTTASYPSGGNGWLETALKHVECLDCHNPHSAAKGPNEPTKAYSFQRSQTAWNTNRSTATDDGPIKLSNANKGAWGTKWDLTTNPPSLTALTAELDPATDYVYDLCLKCHSSYGLGTSADYSVSCTSCVAASYPTTQGNDLPDVGSDRTMLTDVVQEFNPNNYGYHPLFDLGKNRPPVGANGNWPGSAEAGSTGDQLNCTDRLGANFSSGLGHAFVAPWGPCTYVTCIDCHKTDTEGDPEAVPYALGPHGSANKWILRGLDRSIVLNGTYNYSSTALISAAANDIIFCFNCHRADVYGPFDTDGDAPKSNYSRMRHNDFAGGHPWMPANVPESGILCMHCHGGAQPGGLHGSNSGPNPWSVDAALASARGKRLLNGATWLGNLRATMAVTGKCYPGKAITGMNSNCTQHGKTIDFHGAEKANYDYDIGTP